MEYKAIDPITRQQAAAELDSDDWEQISMALLRLAMHDSDAGWLQETILPFTSHKHHWVRGTAALCLGHVARLHGKLERERVVAALSQLLTDQDQGTRGKAEDALSDIEMFLPAER